MYTNGHLAISQGWPLFSSLTVAFYARNIQETYARKSQLFYNTCWQTVDGFRLSIKMEIIVFFFITFFRSNIFLSWCNLSNCHISDFYISVVWPCLFNWKSLQNGRVTTIFGRSRDQDKKTPQTAYIIWQKQCQWSRNVPIHKASYV